MGGCVWGGGYLITTHGGCGIWSLASISCYDSRRRRIRGGFVQNQRPTQVLVRFIIKDLLIWHKHLAYRGIKYTYFKLKYSPRVSLRVEHWASVILTCSWSTSTKCYLHIKFFIRLPPGRDIWSPLIRVRSLIASLDFMLRLALIPRRYNVTFDIKICQLRY